MLRLASLKYSEIHTPLFMFCLSLSLTLTHIRNPGVEKEDRCNFCCLLSHGRQNFNFLSLENMQFQYSDHISHNKTN